MSSGIYVYLPTAQKPDKEATKKVPEKERSHSPIKYPDAKEPSISSESDAKPNKDGVLLNAISLIEARSLLEPLVKSLLGVSPKYIFEKRKNGAQVVYDCMMLIQAKYPPKEKMYMMFEGNLKKTKVSWINFNLQFQEVIKERGFQKDSLLWMRARTLWCNGTPRRVSSFWTWASRSTSTPFFVKVNKSKLKAEFTKMRF